MYRLLALCLLAPLCIVAAERPQISADALAAKLKSEAPPIVLDVRSDDEFADGRIPAAKHVPFREVKKRHAELKADKDREIVVYCQAGVRAAFAEKALRKLGYNKVVHLDGDWPAWRDGGHPVEKPAGD